MSKRITTKELHEEIVGLREILEAIFDTLAIDEKVVVEVEPETMKCQVHEGAVMYKRKGPHGVFYSHGKEVGEGRWINCTGSGWRMNKVS